MSPNIPPLMRPPKKKTHGGHFYWGRLAWKQEDSDGHSLHFQILEGVSSGRGVALGAGVRSLSRKFGT